ncbi:MAG TPA: hypothetical protein VH741_04055 [Candidatus Limnocylindrales bacterium]
MGLAQQPRAVGEALLRARRRVVRRRQAAIGIGGPKLRQQPIRDPQRGFRAYLTQQREALNQQRPGAIEAAL